jgi:lipoprotein-anchoring transpeptidase ErfK/SrfK
MLNRRFFIALAAMSGLAACATVVKAPVPDLVPEVEPVWPPLPAFYGAITTEPYPVPAIAEGVLDPALWRQEVANPWPDHPQGTIIVDPDAAVLHFVEGAGVATRYGVSVGAEGFAWAGTARVQFTREWPVWKVPEAMITRKPELAPYSVNKGGMPPGPGNPMGARALYLFQDGVDTLYRVHGGARAPELGKAVSSGCIRLLDQDAIHLQARSVHGAAVIVLASIRPAGVAQVY